MAAKAKTPTRRRKKIVSVRADQVSARCPDCLADRALSEPGLYGVDVTCGCGQVMVLVRYELIVDPAILERWLADVCEPAGATAFDYETTGLDVHLCKIVGVSFAPDDRLGVACYVPIRHRLGACMPVDAAESILRAYISTHNMIAHNFDFEMRVSMVQLGVEPVAYCDSMFESALDDSGRTSRFDPRSIRLKEMSLEVFDIQMIELDELIDLKHGQTFDYVPTKMARDYGCQDSDLAARLKNRFRARNAGPPEAGGQPHIHYLEHELISITAEMELTGMPIDLAVLEAAGPVLRDERERVMAEIERLSGVRVDPESPEQVADLLFRKMGVPFDEEYVGEPTADWPEGMPSSSKKALALIRDAYEIVDLVLTARELEYALLNYVEKIPEIVSPDTCTVYSQLNQLGAGTGRYSSGGDGEGKAKNDRKKRTINLQNIAKQRD